MRDHLPTEAPPIPLGAVLASLGRQWWIIGSTLALALAAGWTFVWQAPAVWRASSLLFVENGGAAHGVGGAPIGATADDFAGVQAELLSSATVLAEAVRGISGGYDRVDELAGGTVSPIMWLKKELDVRPDRSDGTIEISFESENVDAACELVNAIVTSFQSFHEKQRQSSSSASYQRLLAEENRLHNEHAAKLEEQREYRVARGVADAGKLLDVVWSRWQRLKSELLVAESEAADAHAAWEKAKELGAEPDLLRHAMSTLTAHDPPATPELEIRALREKRTGAFGHLTDEHPSVRALQESIELLRETDAAAIQAYVQALETRWQSALVHRDRLEEEIRALETRVDTLTVDEAGDRLFDAEVQQLSTNLAGVRSLIQTVSLSEPTQGPNVFVLESARPDTSVNVSRKLFRLAALGVLGLLAGVALAALRGVFDRRVRRLEDVESAGLTVLGGWPQLARRRSQRKLPARWSHGSQYSDAARALCAAIDAHARDTECPVLMITEIDPGVSGADVAMGVAMAFAKDWRRTLLIDADSRGSALAKLIGVGNTTGLAELLGGEIDASAAVQSTEIRSLDALVGGPRSDEVDELLTKRALTGVLEGLRQQYDCIVLSVAPLLKYADARVIAPLCDAVILTLQRNRTSRDRIAAARDALSVVGVEPLGGLVGGMAVLSTGRATLHASPHAGSSSQDFANQARDDGKSPIRDDDVEDHRVALSGSAALEDE